MLVFTEKGIYRLSLRTWYIVVKGINTFWTCKGITLLPAKGVCAARKETVDTQRADLFTWFVGLKCQYSERIVTFTTSANEKWNTLAETLAKIGFRTLW